MTECAPKPALSTETLKQAIANANATQRAIIEDFSLFSDWTDKYQYLIDLGRALPPFPDEWKTPMHRVAGCQSQLWLRTVLESPECLRFFAFSDSILVNGLAALILRVYSGHPPSAILGISPDFIKETGLDTHLVSKRVSGIASMLDRVRELAQEYC